MSGPFDYFVVNYLRLHRPKTDSYITIHLLQPIDAEQIDFWVQDNMPGWEYVTCSTFNPDSE